MKNSGRCKTQLNIVVLILTITMAFIVQAASEIEGISPEPEFSSSPVAGTTFEFESINIGTTSSPFELTVDNLGTAELTLACEITGTDSNQFSLLVCPGAVTPAGSVGIAIDCQPDSTGLKQASLDVSSNDADEPTVSYPLTCTGIVSPSGSFVFSTGFETTTMSDLLLINTSANPFDLTPEQAFTIETTVSNQGAASSAASTLHFYLSDDSVISADDLLLSSEPVPVLASGGSSSYNLDTTAPDAGGTWWAGACVDAVMGESNTLDQCSNGVAITVAKLGSITIRKASVGGIGAFSFTGLDMDHHAGIIGSPFVLSTDGNDANPDFITFSGLLPGQYLFTETVPANWTIDGTLGDIVCSGQSSSSVTPEKESLDLVLLDGENLDCTFTNSSTLDSDNDRLTDAEETNTGIYVNSKNTGSDPNNPDSDGDGIKDGDEVLGTLNGLDLPGMGTNPVRKDLLLEYDWFEDSIDCGSHDHRPTPTAIALVSTAFSDSPTGNPGADNGVNLISDYGQGGAFTGGNLINDADGVIAGGVGGSDFTSYKAANFAANRNGYFRYVLLPHRYNTNSGSSGQAEVVGDDLIVSLYCYGSNQNVANTIMHEVGHNLGLLHGGNENCNHKPNYNSVMNYDYQFPGIDNNCTPPGNGVLSYSVGDRISLTESNLNENNGTCGPGNPWDWNNNGSLENTSITNINEYDGEITSCGGLLTTLNDHNDWDNMLFGGIGDSDGAPLVPVEIITEQPIPAEFQNNND